MGRRMLSNIFFLIFLFGRLEKPQNNWLHNNIKSSRHNMMVRYYSVTFVSCFMEYMRILLFTQYKRCNIDTLGLVIGRTWEASLTAISMMMTRDCCSQTILQKSPMVLDRGAWVAMYAWTSPLYPYNRPYNVYNVCTCWTCFASITFFYFTVISV